MSSSPESTADTTSDRAVELFRYSRDPVVNFGVGVIAHLLDDDNLATVTDAGVYVNPETDSDRIESVLLTAAKRRFSRNCVRTNASERYNEWAVNYPSDVPLVPTPSTAFQSLTSPVPGCTFWDGKVFESPFDHNQITAEQLEAVGVPESVQAEIMRGGDERNVYTLAPHYTGPTDANRGGKGDGVAKCIVQFAGWVRFLADFRPTGDDDLETDSCGCCGGTEFPTYKIPEESFPDDEGGDIDLLEVGKTETPMVASGGKPKPLGYQYESSKHPGRCVRCLIAGMFGNISNKPYVQTDEHVEIIIPKADINTLSTIAGYTSVERANGGIPGSQAAAANTNLSELTSGGQAMLRLSLYHELLQLTQQDPTASDGLFATAAELEDTGTSVGTVQFSKGYVSRHRRWSLNEFTETNPSSWPFRLVSQRTVNTQEGTEDYWPAETVLAWVNSIRDGDRRLKSSKSMFADGLLHQDFEAVAVALFELLKELENDAAPSLGINTRQSVHYFTSVMVDSNTAEQTALSDDEVESLQLLAETVSSKISTGSPVGRLNKLHRAKSLSAFQEALSEVAFAVTKETIDNPDEYVPNSDEFQPAVRALADPATFDTARGQFLTLLNLHTAVTISREAYENGNDN